MPSFLFEVQRGKYAGGRFAEASFLCDEAAAWAAAVEVCSDLLKDVFVDITPNRPEWRLTVSDEDTLSTVFVLRRRSSADVFGSDLK